MQSHLHPKNSAELDLCVYFLKPLSGMYYSNDSTALRLVFVLGPVQIRPFCWLRIGISRRALYRIHWIRFDRIPRWHRGQLNNIIARITSLITFLHFVLRHEYTFVLPLQRRQP